MPNSNSNNAIVLCTGSFHVPLHYEILIAALQQRGFQVVCPRLPTMSVCDVSPDNPDDPAFDALPSTGAWPDGAADAKVIRDEAKRLADAGSNVLLVGHSYGGWVATEAASTDLLLKSRAAKGEMGGIIGIFYVAGYILPYGQSIHSFFSPQGDATPLPPFVTLHKHGKQGLVTPVKMEEHFFHDLPLHQARAWATELRAQPVIRTPLTQTSYKEVPCAYLKCAADKVFPPFVQDIMIKTATDQGAQVREYECDKGHCQYVSYAEGLADDVQDFGKSLT